MVFGVRTIRSRNREVDNATSVYQQCGRKVLIQLDRGRNKVDIQEGVIQNAYPSVFTILVNDEQEENPPQLLSFSYSDIITRDIRMKLC